MRTRLTCQSPPITIVIPSDKSARFSATPVSPSTWPPPADDDPPPDDPPDEPLPPPGPPTGGFEAPGLGVGEGFGQVGQLTCALLVFALLEILTFVEQSPVFTPTLPPVLPEAEFPPVLQLELTLLLILEVLLWLTLVEFC